ncbi:MAG TPA: 2OG-Fe(II) oxygenase, partial [Rhodopila sp.]|nr:2OG-Fe(II) oxygenase [Rhodopila sp.]
DTDGFWLEPHTDIGAKLFTMLICLSDDPDSEAWGTDLLDAQGTPVQTAPYRRNCGLIFIPGRDTWHGFHRRPIRGVRRSLIVNYVEPEWRSRHELAFPDQLVGG